MKRVHRPIYKKKCTICHVLINQKNLKKHMERKNLQKQRDITLESECVDPINGVYAVKKSNRGASTPLHVELKVWGENQHVSCESSECQANMEMAWRSGLMSYQCIHLKSVAYCTSYASSPVLQENTLTEMVASKWFGEEKKKLCLNRQNVANKSNVPLSVYVKIGTPGSKKFISIYEPTVSFYSRLSRVMVTYDTKKHTWHCPCEKTKRSCAHKYIAKWHLFQTDSEIFRKVRSTDDEQFQSTVTEDRDSNDETDQEDQLYPPKDSKKIAAMVQYILDNKKLPAVLPEHLRLPSVEKDYPRHLIPLEMICPHCPGKVPLSDPVRITSKAKILTTTRIVEGRLVKDNIFNLLLQLQWLLLYFLFHVL